MEMKRKWPNFLVTGTPATGKSTLCDRIRKSCPQFTAINIGDFAKQHQLYDGYDEEFECHVIDEESLIDKLRPTLENKNGAIVIDYHGCDLFPSEWFNAVFVLRTSNTLLYDRLLQRNYSEKKLKNNVECEIFQTILDEANEAFDSDAVFELQNDTEQDLEKNVEFIVDWLKKWPHSNHSS
ncbi:adenylate kinase isoenzyme 6-like protein [Dinothrombium tinctorium]|uniref:Adenylate kinase isoenzyme 6 homolog n=1 Tax=Dinothrombium tinctorium TaxID=1965070 RepID=A0A443Q881_9ACAR|nr:adenylate kinase isoenzyme 6-like protein [Dinothrombium tinctorium]RWR99246.1 adenylate kinase isoenzyme 6-like protein [Dinothrombium tinctorium]RWR99449.1 adenylate kinase isoenzyme 6-like protein [Dinothrombium tinctorium]